MAISISKSTEAVYMYRFIIVGEKTNAIGKYERRKKVRWSFAVICELLLSDWQFRRNAAPQ